MTRTDAILLTLAALVEVILLGALAHVWGAAAFGAGLALLGGIYGLAKIRAALARVPSVAPRAGQNLVLAALVSSMLGRILLLGLGLFFGATALALDPLWIVVAFFGIYALTLGLEIRLAISSRDVTPAEEPAS